jgi:hypothetical protein
LASENRVYIEDKATGQLLSPFHDIPLWANEQKVRAVAARHEAEMAADSNCSHFHHTI